MAPDDVHVWYEKVKPLLDHVNQQSKRHCSYPSYCISIDEQMKKFKGRSAQTVRMKNKPIKEGFKFFALCDTTEGYVYHFVPNGRLEETRIADTVLGLVRTLPDRENKRYVYGIDKYFTLPRTLAGCRELGVRNHIEQVWGPNFEVDIEIPRVIDDYNHWMFGVDKSDQLIAYYRPTL